jgi:hypothetical protein
MLPGRPSCQPRVPVDQVRRSPGDLYGHPKVRRTVCASRCPGDLYGCLWFQWTGTLPSLVRPHPRLGLQWTGSFAPRVVFMIAVGSREPGASTLPGQPSC